MPLSRSKLHQDENVIRFNTYYYYLHCISRFLDQKYGDWEQFCDNCIDSTESLQGMGELDEDWLTRFLKISWNTEYLLSVDLGDIDLIRINNQWAPIQAYYALYAMCEAVAYILDGDKVIKLMLIKRLLKRFLPI